MVQSLVQNAALCRQELCAVSIREIEIHERVLMEGLNYEFRCHHPTEALRELATKMVSLVTKGNAVDVREPANCCHARPGDRSPRGTLDSLATIQSTEMSLEQVLEVSQLAYIFSDALFLFSPSHAAVAISAIVHGSFNDDGNLDNGMRDCLQLVFPTLVDKQLDAFVSKANDVLATLLKCPFVDLRLSSRRYAADHDVVAKRAEALRVVLGNVSHLRMLDQMRRQDQSYLGPSSTYNYCNYGNPPTRKRSFESYFPEHSTPYPCLRPRSSRRICRVTPTTYYSG
jgi:hypothetical protein